MIELVGLQKSFGAKQVLAGVDLTIPDGSIFGLVGINGAGKSTLLRLLAGVLRADGGQALADGEAVYENEEKKREIFFLLCEKTLTADEIVGRTEIPARRVNTALTILQAGGYLKELPGRRFAAAVRFEEHE